jgi:hypothetical protein
MAANLLGKFKNINKKITQAVIKKSDISDSLLENKYISGISCQINAKRVYTDVFVQVVNP